MACVEAFFDVFTFELSEGRKDSNRRPPEWGLGINGFTEGDEFDVMGKKKFFDEGEGITLGTTQSVEAVDKDEVNFFSLNVFNELL